MYLHLMENFHEQELREPKHSYEAVAENYRQWHVSEVFRGYKGLYTNRRHTTLSPLKLTR